MKSKRFLLRIFIGGFVLVGLFFVGGIAFFFFAMSSEDSKESIGKPASEMMRTTGMPFTEKTRDIHYFIFAAGMQELAIYCKFTCDSSEAEAIADEFMNQNEGTRTPARERVVTTHPPFGYQDYQRFPQLNWWDLDRATVVKEIRVNASHGYDLWIARVDESTSRIYIYELD